MERREGEEIHITPSPGASERGMAGGVAPAAAAWPVVGVDRIHWGPVWAGLLVAISTQIVLSALGLALGLYRLGTPSAGLWWTALWGLIALWLGGFTAARLAAAPTGANGLWHGAIVWALTLVLGTLLAALGIVGVLSFLPTRTLATPGATPADITGPAWGFLLGAVLGLLAAMWGGWTGSRREAATESRETR